MNDLYKVLQVDPKDGELIKVTVTFDSGKTILTSEKGIIKRSGLVFAYLYDKFIDRETQKQFPFKILEVSTYQPSIVLIPEKVLSKMIEDFS